MLLSIISGIILVTCILVMTVTLILILTVLLYVSFMNNVFIHTNYIPFIIFGFLLTISFVAMLGFNITDTIAYNTYNKRKGNKNFEWIIRRQYKYYKYNNFKEWSICIVKKTFITFAIISLTIASIVATVTIVVLKH